MSTEPDYNFNEPVVQESATPSLSLPFALISAALAVFMAAQTGATFFNRTNLIEGKNQLIQGKAQLADLSKSRDKAVEESKKVQKQLQDLVLDLLLLAKTDDEAKAIVNKFQIQQQAPAAGAEAPAPAPAP
jgi:hypothetical protein